MWPQLFFFLRRYNEADTHEQLLKKNTMSCFLNACIITQTKTLLKIRGEQRPSPHLLHECSPVYPQQWWRRAGNQAWCPLTKTCKANTQESFSVEENSQINEFEIENFICDTCRHKWQIISLKQDNVKILMNETITIVKINHLWELLQIFSKLLRYLA